MIIAGAGALFTVPLQARATARRHALVGPDPVERAMDSMGGRALLERVRTVRWTGTATVPGSKKARESGVETSFEPFRRAQSQSFLLSEDRTSMRTLLIEGSNGATVIEGRQIAMPPARALYESQQFGAYGYLLMAGVTWSATGGGRLDGTHPDFPPITLRCDTAGRVLAADYAISAPDGDGVPIREHFRFSGVVSDKGLNWPKKILITQNGRPYSALVIEQLWVDLR